MSKHTKNQRNNSKRNNSKNKLSPYEKLVVDIRNNIITQQAELISIFLNSAQEELFKLSNDADSNEDQTRYFDLMNQIRTQKTTIADIFSKNIKNYLVPAATFDEIQKKKKSLDDDDELSLIGQDEMDGIVLVKNIGGRTAVKYSEQLSHLEARLEYLALKTDTIFKNNTLAPANFCQAFNDALANDFDNTNKKLLFAMFDIEVANKLDSLYDSINNRLIDAEILPQIKLHMDKQAASRPRPKPPESTAENSDAETQHHDGDRNEHRGASETSGPVAGGQRGNQPSGSNIGGFAMTAPPGGGYRRANQNSAPSPASGNNAGNTSSGGAEGNQAGGDNTGSPQGGPTDEQANKQETSSENGEYQHYTAGLPASKVGRVLSNYIGSPFTPGAADGSSDNHAESFPESTQQHFGHQEVIQALSGIQNLPEFNQTDGQRLDGEVIKQAVLSEIAKTSGGAVTKRINQIAAKTIDFIELIFDAIIEDSDISDAIKALLLRLQIPVIKASMLDQEFFIYDDHPARLLLDTIADAGVGVTEHSDEMYKQLEKVIFTILGEYELTTETFQNGLDNLNEYIEGQEAIIRSKEEEEQKQVLRKHARATVLRSLRATTTGKTLPEAVHPLILKRWPTLMFNHYLANGKENNEWVNIVLTLRHIVDSVQPIKSAEQLTRLSFERDVLFDKTENYLNTSSNSKKDVQNIIVAYKETVQNNIDDANFTKDEVNVAEETIKHAEPVEEAPIEEDTHDKPSIPPNVMPGMWFQVYMGEDHPPRRCKLSVILVEDASLMFVNHKGELLVEKYFDEFNEEVANGTTKMIMGHSAFDHAFKAVINRLD